MILRDFHMHSRYSDGKDSCESMIISAIEKKMTAIGFSDHSDPKESDLYMPPERKKAYIAEVSELKKKYEGQIEIFCGLELDCLTPYEEDEGIDYIIGSVHYIKHKGELYPIDHSHECMQKTLSAVFGGDFSSYAEAYFECVSRLKDSRRADIIGHFDLLTKFSELGTAPDLSDTRYVNAWRASLDALGSDTLFEANTGAISRGYRSSFYPSEDILGEMAKRGCPVILSSDSHSKDNICFGFDEAEKAGLSHGIALKDTPFR